MSDELSKFEEELHNSVEERSLIELRVCKLFLSQLAERVLKLEERAATYPSTARIQQHLLASRATRVTALEKQLGALTEKFDTFMEKFEVRQVEADKPRAGERLLVDVKDVQRLLGCSICRLCVNGDLDIDDKPCKCCVCVSAFSVTDAPFPTEFRLAHELRPKKEAADEPTQ